MLAEVLDLVREDQRLTIREVAEEVGVSFGSCQSILTKDLGIKHESAKFGQQLLTVEQKEHYLPEASLLLECVEANKNVFRNIVTAGEKWCVV